MPCLNEVREVKLKNFVRAFGDAPKAWLLALLHIIASALAVVRQYDADVFCGEIIFQVFLDISHAKV